MNKLTYILLLIGFCAFPQKQAAIVAMMEAQAQVEETPPPSYPIVIEDYTFANQLSSTTVTLNKPDGVATDDLLLIFVANDQAGTGEQWTTPPTGFTKLQEANISVSTDVHVAVFYRIADGTEGATIDVVANTTNDNSAFYLRVSGVDPLDPINQTGAEYRVVSTTHVIPGVTTDESNCLAFYVYGSDGADCAPYSVSGTGWSETAETNAGGTASQTVGLTFGTKEMPTAGATGDATVTFSASDGGCGFQFALNENI